MHARVQGETSAPDLPSGRAANALSFHPFTLHCLQRSNKVCHTGGRSDDGAFWGSRNRSERSCHNRYRHLVDDERTNWRDRGFGRPNHEQAPRWNGWHVRRSVFRSGNNSASCWKQGFAVWNSTTQHPAANDYVSPGACPSYAQQLINRCGHVGKRFGICSYGIGANVPRSPIRRRHQERSNNSYWRDAASRADGCDCDRCADDGFAFGGWYHDARGDGSRRQWSGRSSNVHMDERHSGHRDGQWLGHCHRRGTGWPGRDNGNDSR